MLVASAHPERTEGSAILDRTSRALAQKLFLPQANWQIFADPTGRNWLRMTHKGACEPYGQAHHLAISISIMPSERVQRQIDLLLDEAEEAISRQGWNIVGERAQAVLRLDPENQDALSYL